MSVEVTYRGRGNREGDVTFGLSREATPLSIDAEADREVTGPRPKDGGVGEGDIKKVAMTTEVGVPDWLEGYVSW